MTVIEKLLIAEKLQLRCIIYTTRGKYWNRTIKFVTPEKNWMMMELNHNSVCSSSGLSITEITDIIPEYFKNFDVMNTKMFELLIETFAVAE